MRFPIVACRMAVCLALGLTAGCDSGETAGIDPVADASSTQDAGPQDAFIPRDGAPAHDGVHGFANGCYQVEGYTGSSVRLLQSADAGFAFVEGADAARFRLRATDLGTYLLYDTDRRYFVAEAVEDAWQFTRPAQLDSDIMRLDDTYQSPAEWTVQVSSKDGARFQLQHRASGQFLTLDGLGGEADAAVIAFLAAEGCADFPEMGIDAEGVPEPRAWPDGDLYGVAEVHSHMMSNFGFGGGNMFHGAPFHRLGVEHALPDCEPFHGEDGKRDLIGLFYDGDLAFDIASLLPIILAGTGTEFNHHTTGWPAFTDWPNAWARSTHQVMYYRWLERAWRGGLRLMVQHATGNSVLCEFSKGVGAGQTRYSCNDMVSVDRSIAETRALERYIDAQAGGPGKGWFRVVDSPAEARQVIGEGKLAVVLGIEISNLFDCFLTPPEGMERCTIDDVRTVLDRYKALGVRVVFPVHKFDNGFGPGDGSGGIIELGNFINSGHYNSQIEDCPLGRQSFDNGALGFSALNEPRDDFEAPAPFDMSGFGDDPVGALRPHLGALASGGQEGNFCQSATMTALGETLLHEMMVRGMLPDISHLPQRSLIRALEILNEQDYPAMSTHGNTHDDALFDLQGITGVRIGSCGSADSPGSMGNAIRRRTQARAEHGAHSGTPFAFDLNGFAGSRRPRFGENSRCDQPQANPVEYPFTSYDGAVAFQQPHLGEREVDFNTEGFIHVGLLPELIEDARRDGMTDEALEPLFRSAETMVRTWERAEARAAELR